MCRQIQRQSRAGHRYDWLPTFLDYAGAADRVPGGLPGWSFAPLLAGQVGGKKEHFRVRRVWAGTHDPLAGMETHLALPGRRPWTLQRSGWSGGARRPRNW